MHAYAQEERLRGTLFHESLGRDIEKASFTEAQRHDIYEVKKERQDALKQRLPDHLGKGHRLIKEQHTFEEG